MLKEQEGIDVDGDDRYWQVSAQWALLAKYGYLPDTLQDRYTKIKGRRQLEFSESDMDVIQRTWDKLKDQPADTDDLTELLHTGKSCGREIQWAVMDCPPATQFRLHAHPNIELVYCARGALHEIRMNGPPLVKKFATGKISGPNLGNLNRPWYFDTLNEGEWLVNEVGSIHKSFTSTNGDGCVLVVLWGGSHADIEQAPKQVNVQAAVDHMDQKLCECGNGDKLSETFLPDSEKSNSD